MDKIILAPGIVLYKSNTEEVKKLLDQVEPALKNNWKPAQGVNTTTNSNEVVEARKCYDCALTEFHQEPMAKSLYESIDSWIQEKVDDYAQTYSVEKLEKGPYIFIKYQYNDKFDWHIDDGKKYPRTVSVSAYLNDDYEGGEIEFNHFGISHKPTSGDIIVFSSSHPYMHRVKPVLSGTRYAIVNWYRYAGYPAEMSLNV
jgi:hypothetical protein